MVAVGVTAMLTPLVAGRLPGVMTPVPSAKIPNKVELDPSVMEVGFAVKLVMVGKIVVVALDAPPQPVKLAMPRPRVMASGIRTRIRFMGSPPDLHFQVSTGG